MPISAWRGTSVPRLNGPASAPGEPTDEAEACRFLVGRLIDESTLRRATAEAGRSGVATHQVLIAHGWITPQDYAAALSAELMVPDPRGPEWRARPTASVLLDAAAAPPNVISAEIAVLVAAGTMPCLVSLAVIDWSEPQASRSARVQEAAGGLLSRRPAMSAGSPIASWLLVSIAVTVGIAAGGLFMAPAETLTALTALVTLPFLFVVGLRVLSLFITLAERRALPSASTTDRRTSAHTAPGPASRLTDADLPIYSIIIPLYREAEVLPDIVQSMAALDYPQTKLDILLVLESVDTETRHAALDLDLPPNIRVVIVPEMAPRTKPKALNYALELARGSYVVIYDAEDEPEPDQLRLALAAFAAGPASLACVQARLNIYNADANWLTRQFTLEYSALFDALLPALVRLRLPIPLGGTSNHFPIAVLRRLGGWDPHNVTEDADLGLRIARGGGRVAVISSTTWEEAPPAFRIWLPQRTRWLKGFMQTWLVHMRDPRLLLTELGLVGFLGFQAFLGGVILSALIYPIFVVLFVADIVAGRALGIPQSSLGTILLGVAVFNLVGGYVSGVTTAGVTAARRGYHGMVLSLVLMPAYWLLISLAGYRALIQLVRHPYLWEKTPHAPRAPHGRRVRRSGR